MSLDVLLKPVGWLDSKVQNQFTIIGMRIPEKHLYKITTALNMVSKLGTVHWGIYLGINPIVSVVISGFFLDGADFSYNFNGLMGRIRTKSGETTAIDPEVYIQAAYNRVVRLPAFLIGTGFLERVVYDVMNHFSNNEPMPQNTPNYVLSGVGFILCAASMYLKDQNPKALEKKPSKVKQVLNVVYARLKPVHVNN